MTSNEPWPTYASWLNQVERWFALITQKAIPRRGSFSSVKELIAKIEQFVAAYNKTKPRSTGRRQLTQSWRSSRDSARK